MRTVFELLTLKKPCIRQHLTHYLFAIWSGLQGQLWTEVIRTAEQFDNMVYPRLLALAERAWHEAEWEHLSRDNGQRKKEQEEDWRDFSNTLGYKELGRLDACSIKYYLPPPGGR